MKILNFEEAIIKKYSDKFIKEYKKGNKIQAGKITDTFPPLYKNKIITTIRNKVHEDRDK
jgi:hypothetical protein